MKRIKEYLVDRNLETTKKILKEAMKIMIRAKFNKILKNIKNEELKENILKEIDKKLS